MELVEVASLEDPRLRDYAHATDVALKNARGAQGLYIAESALVLERALRAGHRPRSVLALGASAAEAERLVGDHDVPVFTGPGELLAELTGYVLHRGLIAAMDRPSAGKIAVLGEDLTAMSDKEIAHWRNEHIGFVFQTFNLIPVLTALENVELPLKLTNLSGKERLEHAATALKLVGLGERTKHFPRQLSGGQEQRETAVTIRYADGGVPRAGQLTGGVQDRPQHGLGPPDAAEFQGQIEQPAQDSRLVSPHRRPSSHCGDRGRSLTTRAKAPGRR